MIIRLRAFLNLIRLAPELLDGFRSLERKVGELTALALSSDRLAGQLCTERKDFTVREFELTKQLAEQAEKIRDLRFRLIEVVAMYEKEMKKKHK